MSKQLSGVSLKMFTALTGKVNSNPFMGFAPGEVLFEGASGSKQDAGIWDVTYKFKASENVEQLGNVGGIMVGAKRGWDYFWVQYMESADENTRTKQPMAAYVEVVYKEANFSPLLM
jgi:hypothetical protein